MFHAKGSENPPRFMRQLLNGQAIPREKEGHVWKKRWNTNA